MMNKFKEFGIRLKLRFPAIFDKSKNKYFIFASFLLVLSIITYSSYALFVIATEGFRATDMQIANLTYSIKIDGTSTKSQAVPANTTKIVDVEVTSLNQIKTKYILYYTASSLPSGLSVKYSDLTDDLPTGTIESINAASGKTKKIRVAIVNNSSSSVTINFDIQGGYSYNTNTLKSGRYEINTVYKELETMTGDIVVRTYVDGAAKKTFPTASEITSKDLVWDKAASTCTNGATITYNSSTNTASVENVTKQTVCVAAFATKADVIFSVYVDGIWAQNIPEKNSGKKYVSGNCTDNTGGSGVPTITWDSTNWKANVNGIREVPTFCTVNFSS